MRTIRVRMKTRYANGTRAIEPDREADLPADEAQDLIDKGFAVAVGADPSRGEKPTARAKPAKKAAAATKTPADPDTTKTDPNGGGPGEGGGGDQGDGAGGEGDR